MAPCNLLLCLVEIVAERAGRNEDETNNPASNANTANQETNDNEANDDLGERSQSEGKEFDIRCCMNGIFFEEIV